VTRSRRGENRLFAVGALAVVLMWLPKDVLAFLGYAVAVVTVALVAFMLGVGPRLRDRM
jgi:hypothetical protein